MARGTGGISIRTGNLLLLHCLPTMRWIIPQPDHVIRSCVCKPGLWWTTPSLLPKNVQALQDEAFALPSGCSVWP